eukprot:1156883-Pelagomonas_calceolata.AAC.5
MNFSVLHAQPAHKCTSASLPPGRYHLLVHHLITAATGGKRQGHSGQATSPSGARQLLALLEEDFKAECHATLHTNGVRGLRATSATRTSPVVKLPVRAAMDSLGFSPTSATLAVPLDALGGQYLTTIDRQLGPLPAALMDLLTGNLGPRHCVSPSPRETGKKSMGIRRVTSASLILVMRVENTLLKSASGASKFINALDRVSMKLQSKLGGCVKTKLSKRLLKLREHKELFISPLPT